jgi:phosphoadenosine phosphosulfate reductase
MENNTRLKELSDQLSDKSIEGRLEKLANLFRGKTIFTTSFGIEDQVITHKIFRNNLNIEIATLDTGRLFPQTYDVFSNTNSRYNKRISVYFPEYQLVEKMVSEKGPFSFFESRENRLECCRLRKVIPLNRALEGMECWISGIRASQSDDRSQMKWLEYDDDRKLFIKENNVPYNALHDKGYVSIGCEPCTRAVKKDEDFRAGRWWWENDGPKECGCHIKG